MYTEFNTVSLYAAVLDRSGLLRPVFHFMCCMYVTYCMYTLFYTRTDILYAQYTCRDTKVEAYSYCISTANTVSNGAGGTNIVHLQRRKSTAEDANTLVHMTVLCSSSFRGQHSTAERHPSFMPHPKIVTENSRSKMMTHQEMVRRGASQAYVSLG